MDATILDMITTTDVEQWLTMAQELPLSEPIYQRGIAILDQLFEALIPKKTALLPNYPNPFNPETWIPYHLAKDVSVQLQIYTVNGTLVRTLSLGYQASGVYQSRSHAAYWDGKNEIGEYVGSGVYFVQMNAGDFSSTRRLVILK